MTRPPRRRTTSQWLPADPGHSQYHDPDERSAPGHQHRGKLRHPEHGQGGFVQRHGGLTDQRRQDHALSGQPDGLLVGGEEQPQLRSGHLAASQQRRHPAGDRWHRHAGDQHGDRGLAWTGPSGPRRPGLLQHGHDPSPGSAGTSGLPDSADLPSGRHAPLFAAGGRTVRTFTAQGVCGVPVGAAVASLHVGVTAPAYGGFVTVYPSNIATPWSRPSTSRPESRRCATVPG